MIALLTAWQKFRNKRQVKEKMWAFCSDWHPQWRYRQVCDGKYVSAWHWTLWRICIIRAAFRNVWQYYVYFWQCCLFLLQLRSIRICWQSNAISYKKCTRKQAGYEKIGNGNSVTQVGACRPSMESALISRDLISSSAVSRDEPVTCIMNAIGGSISIAVICWGSRQYCYKQRDEHANDGQNHDEWTVSSEKELDPR